MVRPVVSQRPRLVGGAAVGAAPASSNIATICLCCSRASVEPLPPRPVSRIARSKGAPPSSRARTAIAERVLTALWSGVAPFASLALAFAPADSRYLMVSDCASPSMTACTNAEKPSSIELNFYGVEPALFPTSVRTALAVPPAFARPTTSSTNLSFAIAGAERTNGYASACPRPRFKLFNT